MAKVFERIAYDQYTYLEKHNILCKYQSGFRAIYSADTAFMKPRTLGRSWTNNIDSGKINGVVILPRNPLIGIYGNAHKLVQSYLENRAQMFFINCSLSQSCSLSRGVPQGTILGPLLFLVYISDLLNCLSNCKRTEDVR